MLDCLINPQWPYLPAKKERYSSKAEERGIERAWSSVPDDPLNYHFLYHLLEADENGQPPKLKGSKNTQFNQSSKSALHYIAESNNKVTYPARKCQWCFSALKVGREKKKMGGWGKTPNLSHAKIGTS